jgi:hypothetical protein
LGLVLYAVCALSLTVFSAELQRVDENRSVVRYKFAFQWCEGQGDPWWSLGTEEAPVTQAPNSQLCESEPGVMTISLEERENLTSSKWLRLLYSWETALILQDDGCEAYVCHCIF